MRDRELYAKLLGVEAPWHVCDVKARLDAGEVEILIEFDSKETMVCPECADACGGYDTRTRSWRHLDTMQYRTVLTAEVPRVKCPEHGVKQISVPWAEPGSRFTALFEALVIDWLHEASMTAVGRQLRCTWDQVDGIQARAVRRGLARREEKPVKHLAVDETSFQKRHEYVTVVSDAEGHVLLVEDGRTAETLENYFYDQPLEYIRQIESISMDMWGPYIDAARGHLPDAEKKIAFDRFHVAAHLNKAVNEVRKQEHRALAADGDKRLAKSRYLWLTNPENLSEKQLPRFEELRCQALKVARAWAIKETARGLWHYKTRGWAKRAWNKWLGWVQRCRLEPLGKVGRMIKKHLYGILNAIALARNNGRAEAINSRIQTLKKRACGYRNRERFRNAIYFHLGGLDLKPRLAHAHSNS